MKIKKVYLGRRQIYPDGWNPGEDVLLYLKLNSTTTNTDEIGTYTWTDQNVTYDSQGAYFNGSNSRLLGNQNLPDASKTTIAFWAKFTYNSQTASPGFIFFDGSSTPGHDLALGPNSNGTLTVVKKTTTGESLISPTQIIDNSKYYCVIITYDTNTISLYVNNQFAGDVSKQGDANVGYHYLPCIGALKDSSSSSSDNNKNWYKGYLSHFVYSNKVWDETERNDYYNKTKGNYGL